VAPAIYQEQPPGEPAAALTVEDAPAETYQVIIAVPDEVLATADESPSDALNEMLDPPQTPPDAPLPDLPLDSRLPLFNVTPVAYAEEPTAVTLHPQPGGKQAPDFQPPLFLTMSFFVPPLPVGEASTDADSEPRMVTVILRSSTDKPRDVRRLKRIYNVLRSYPGPDKFSFLVFESGRRFLMDFPNDTTGISSELIRKLIDLVGEGNVSVEPIKLQ
jgi:DNA polymerase-3 subunit alpha